MVVYRLSIVEEEIQRNEGGIQNSGSKLMHSVTWRVMVCGFDWILRRDAATEEMELSSLRLSLPPPDV